jgi:hypothetical protein
MSPASHALSPKIQTSRGNYLTSLNVQTEELEFAFNGGDGAERRERNTDDMILQVDADESLYSSASRGLVCEGNEVGWAEFSREEGRNGYLVASTEKEQMEG